MTVNYSPSHAAGITTEGTITEDRLFDRNTRVRKVTIAQGAPHLRGEALGKITVGGKYILSLLAAADGSQAIDAILLEDTDATSADAEAMVAIAGDFAIQGVIFGTGHTAAESDALLRTKGIFLDNIVG